MRHTVTDIRHFIRQLRLDEQAVQDLLMTISCTLNDNQCVNPDNAPLIQDAIDEVIGQLDDMLADINDQRMPTCSSCSGSGQGLFDGTICRPCKGQGVINA